jgi:hypothetical protein
MDMNLFSKQYEVPPQNRMLDNSMEYLPQPLQQQLVGQFGLPQNIASQSNEGSNVFPFYQAKPPPPPAMADNRPPLPPSAPPLPSAPSPSISQRPTDKQSPKPAPKPQG